MTATDSVLEALLPQLNGDFDRTLLLVIADRCDELAEGSGEGWRVLNRFGLSPHRCPVLDQGQNRNRIYYGWGSRSRHPFWQDYIGSALPTHWYWQLENLTERDRGSTLALIYPTKAEAYRRAELSWRIQSEAQKQLSLRELEKQ